MKSLCSKCNVEFVCGAQDPAFHCWCLSKPELQQIDAQKNCLCESCFDEAVKKQGTRQSFRLHVAYVGTHFCGYQEQDNGRTVEGELKSALAKISRTDFELDAAGRTDAGVHARGQAVSLHLVTRLSPRQLMLALASHLPKDMSVWRIDQMGIGFDARRHSVGKRYVYRVQEGQVADPFVRDTAIFVRHELDVTAMQDAAQAFAGEHDFGSFRSSNCVAAHARRYLWQCTVTRSGLIEIDIRGNAFCMNMVRIIAGTLIEVGKGKRSKQSILAALVNANRQSAGPTAPAHGLTLEEIYYPDDLSAAGIPPQANFPRFPVTKASWPFR